MRTGIFFRTFIISHVSPCLKWAALFHCNAAFCCLHFLFLNPQCKFFYQQISEVCRICRSEVYRRWKWLLQMYQWVTDNNWTKQLVSTRHYANITGHERDCLSWAARHRASSFTAVICAICTSELRLLQSLQRLSRRKACRNAESHRSYSYNYDVLRL